MNIIDEVLELYDDKSVKELLLLSYTLSSKASKELSDMIFRKILFEVKYYNLKIEMSSDGEDYYNLPDHRIHLGNRIEPVTFFHELMHAFARLNTIFENSNIMDKLNMSDEWNHCLESLMRKCEKEKNWDRMEPCPFHKKEESLPDELIFSLINGVEGAGDAIVGGKFFTESKGFICGHPCKYFELKPDRRIEEFYAHYFSVYLIAPNFPLLSKLNDILGIEFITLLKEIFNKNVGLENNAEEKKQNR